EGRPYNETSPVPISGPGLFLYKTDSVGLVDMQVQSVDDRAPLLDVVFNQLTEFFRRGGRRGGADRVDALDDRRVFQGGRNGFVQALDDGFGRTGGCGDAEPTHGVVTFKTGFLQRGHAGQAVAALGSRDSVGLEAVVLD